MSSLGQSYGDMKYNRAKKLLSLCGMNGISHDASAHCALVDGTSVFGDERLMLCGCIKKSRQTTVLLEISATQAHHKVDSNSEQPGRTRTRNDPTELELGTVEVPKPAT